MTTLLQNLPLSSLPTEEDLPDTDDQPVDNELQLLVPFLLQSILLLAWADRQDWFMGVNIGLYHTVGKPAIGPDALLSLGAERVRENSKLRLSYVVWQEGVMPQWVLEVVSQKPGGEYERNRDRQANQGKLFKYAQMGIKYYTIYNPNYWKRDKHDPFEVYYLVNGVYVRQPGNPVWMPEIGLGIGKGQGTHKGYTQEWLYWYDKQGNQYPAPANVIQQQQERVRQEQERVRQEQQLRQQAERERDQERQQKEQEQKRAEQAETRLEQLAQRLRTLNPEQLRVLGFDPDEVS